MRKKNVSKANPAGPRVIKLVDPQSLLRIHLEAKRLAKQGNAHAEAGRHDQALKSWKRALAMLEEMERIRAGTG